ncbi:MAG: hypothetical protein RLY66_474 [Candidatus Parcubacteria bacterium]
MGNILRKFGDEFALSHTNGCKADALAINLTSCCSISIHRYGVCKLTIHHPLHSAYRYSRDSLHLVLRSLDLEYWIQFREQMVG